MANQERNHTGLRIALATALGLGGASGAVLTGKAILEQASRQPVGATTQYPEGTVMPSQKAFGELVTPTPINTPRPIDTATPEPTPTKKAEPTIAITPTLQPTPEPSPTSIPTETPSPVEKSPLPEYGAFMGNLRNIKTGESGMIMISPIPKKPKGQQIVIYFQEGDRTGTTFGAYPLDLVSIRDNSFKAETLTSGPSWGKGLYVIEAEWNPKTQTIEGRFIRNAKGQLQEEIRTFEVNFLGIGRLKVLEAVKKTKTAVRGGDWTRINIEEFERDITLP